MNTRTLLAIRLRQLGDVLATLGTLRAVKRADPGRRIVFMVDAHYHDLLRPVPFVDRLLVQPPKLAGSGGVMKFNDYIDDLRGLGTDCVLDFHSNTRSALLSWLSGAARRIGFDVRMRKVLYTDVEPRAVFENGHKRPRTAHESAMALAARGGLAGLEDDGYNTLPVSQARVAEGKRALLASGVGEERLRAGAVVGVNPGNPYPAKAWPHRYFVEVARRLVAGGKAVVIMWGPGEKERAARVAGDAGRGVTVAPAMPLAAMPGFVRQLSLIVTIDSGLKHLAVSVGVPTLTLFGPTDPDEWHMGAKHDRYLYENLSCSPCRLLVCPFGSPCMTRLTPDAVVKAAASIGGGTAPR
ncbi:MAG: glycosyltransferase family 9 protein [Candidatus Krumholzibacteriia bacterium]